MGQKIEDWFDIHNDDHLIAWRHLQKTGTWPEDFLPKDIVIDNLWQVEIVSKIANEYVSFIENLKQQSPLAKFIVQPGLANSIASIVLKGIKDAKLERSKKLHDRVNIHVDTELSLRSLDEAECLISESESLQKTIDTLNATTI